MKTLNLVDLEKSDIKYKISPFPDGQQQITIFAEQIDSSNICHKYKDWNGQDWENGITIKSRFNSFKDLELIICATQSFKLLGLKKIHLYVPYFLGSRSDRQFEKGSCGYLKDVVCPIINSQDYSSVTVLDPHSDVLEACLNGFKKESNTELVKWSLNEICLGNDFPRAAGEIALIDLNRFILISPDAGANKKIYKLAEQIDYKGDIITCSKDRDKNGKLTKCIVPLLGDCTNKDIIIIDDIFDYGTTFINIAKEAIKQGHKKGKMYLIVTHSIQTAGLRNASEYFNKIYTTDSIKDHNLAEVKQLNLF